MASQHDDRQDALGLPGTPAGDEAALREARRLMGEALAMDPRPGFAQKVALRALEQRRPFSWLPALRWAVPGLAVAGALAVVLVARTPGAGPKGEVVASNDELAQRLDLYEDLSVVQNREALEEFEVVSVLHELQPEGKP
jgi:hypothetical protein